MSSPSHKKQVTEHLQRIRTQQEQRRKYKYYLRSQSQEDPAPSSADTETDPQLWGERLRPRKTLSGLGQTKAAGVSKRRVLKVNPIPRKTKAEPGDKTKSKPGPSRHDGFYNVMCITFM